MKRNLDRTVTETFDDAVAEEAVHGTRDDAGTQHDALAVEQNEPHSLQRQSSQDVPATPTGNRPRSTFQEAVEAQFGVEHVDSPHKGGYSSGSGQESGSSPSSARRHSKDGRNKLRATCQEPEDEDDDLDEVLRLSRRELRDGAPSVSGKQTLLEQDELVGMLSSSFNRQLSMKVGDVSELLEEEPNIPEQKALSQQDVARPLPQPKEKPPKPTTVREARKAADAAREAETHRKIQEAAFATPVSNRTRGAGSGTSTPASSTVRYSTRRRRGPDDSPLSTCIQDEDQSDEGALKKADSSKKTCLLYDELMLEHVAPPNHPEQPGRILAIINRLHESVR